MGTGRGRERAVDRSVVRRNPPRRRGEGGRARGHPGRGGQRQDQRSAQAGGRDPLRAQRSAGQSARGRPPRLRDEWRTAHAGPRFSAAGDRARLVRDGGGEMAATDHRDRPPLRRLLPDGRLRLLAARRRRRAPGPDHGDECQSRHRPAGGERSYRRREQLQGGGRGLDGRGRDRQSRAEHGRRKFLGNGVVRQREGAQQLAALGV